MSKKPKTTKNTKVIKKTKEKKLSFVGQRPDEKCLFVFRRHIIAMRKGIYLLAIPFILSVIPPLIWSDNLGLFILPLIGLAVGLVFFFYHFILWYYTIYIVTDQRIRHIAQKSFFGRDVVELELSKIQNISYTIPGFNAEVFHYGTIVIQTLVGDLVINNVDHPEKIYNHLQDARVGVRSEVVDETTI